MQRLRACLFAIRSGIGWLHSKRAEVSKYVHWLHACRSAPHFRQVDSKPIDARSSTLSPHLLHRKTTALS